MHEGTDRNFSERQAVADLRSDAAAGSNHLTDLESVRSDDVSLLSVFVLHEGDAGAAVRIILDGLNGRGALVLGAAEVDDAVHTLVTATEVTHGHLTGVVASARALEGLQQ